jgi:enoyl-CoA hydratase/carnithine racemase
MKDLVTVELRNSYAIIRLDRPEKKNAMNRQARRELLAAFHASRAGCKTVVLTGSGDSFCSGVDLKEARADADAGTPLDPQSDWIEVLLAIREHPAIFVAAVNGYALGGGATLISMCDLAIAADEAEIGMPEIGFGAYPQFSGPAAQIQLTPKRAAWLALTAERIDGRTAEAWGMVNRSVALDRLMAEVELLADKLNRFDAVALAESKHALDMVLGSIFSWRQVFSDGMAANARIRASSTAQREGFSRFAAGGRNLGQGSTSRMPDRTDLGSAG